MKRNKIQYPIIKKYWPIILWYECRFCKQEFRREQGFEITDFTKVNRQLYISYCCNNCAKNEEEVRQKINKIDLEFMRRRPNFNLKDKVATNKVNQNLKGEVTMKAYYVENGENTIYTKSINGALGYLINNLPEQIKNNEVIAKLGSKEVTQQEYEKLPSFDEESRNLEALLKEMKLNNKEI